MHGGKIDFFIDPNDKKIPEKPKEPPKEPPKPEEKRVESTPLSFLYSDYDLRNSDLPKEEKTKEFDSGTFTGAHKTSTIERRQSIDFPIPTLPDES